jgi:hypothetical protein
MSNNRTNSPATISPTNSNEPGQDSVHTIDCYGTYDSEAIPKTQARVATGTTKVNPVDPGTNK